MLCCQEQSSPAFPVQSESELYLQPADAFSLEDREDVYKAIFTRRDVRGQFLPDPIRNDTMMRILTAAHLAPSVGLGIPGHQAGPHEARDRCDIR